MTVPLYNLTDTWNAGATVFTAVLMNVTNTASAAASKLFDFQVGGTSYLNLRGASSGAEAGQLWFGCNQGANDSWIGDIGSSILSVNDCVGFRANTKNAAYGSDVFMGFGSGAGASSSSVDAGWYRDGGAGLIAQRNGTNAQTFRIYNTFTDASNYERGVLDWSTSSNIFTVGVQAAGTGTLRPMKLVGSDITIKGDTATPAGGSTAARLLFGTTSGFGIYYGSGAPTVSAAAGSLYIRTDNAGANLRLYSNTTGSTTWAAITSA